MGASLIDPAVLAAYRTARYEVRGPSAFTLRIDEVSTALQAAHRRFGVACSGFLTACNPLGRLLDAAENARRQTGLVAAIDALGHPHWPGVGADPEGHWPGEPSLLVFGIPLAAARALGERHAQNAIVWAGADAVPRLVRLR